PAVPSFPTRRSSDLVSIPRAVLAKLAAAGALRAFDSEPRRLLWEIESLSMDPNSFLWGLPKENFIPSEEEEKSFLPFESRWDQRSEEHTSELQSREN